MYKCSISEPSELRRLMSRSPAMFISDVCFVCCGNEKYVSDWRRCLIHHWLPLSEYLSDRHTDTTVFCLRLTLLSQTVIVVVSASSFPRQIKRVPLAVIVFCLSAACMRRKDLMIWVMKVPLLSFHLQNLFVAACLGGSRICMCLSRTVIANHLTEMNRLIHQAAFGKGYVQTSEGTYLAWVRGIKK